MALTQCWECSKEISDSAAACPHCGAARKAVAVEVIEKPTRKSNTLWWVFGIPAALVVLFLAYGASIPEYKAQALQRRDICQQLAAPYQRGECDRIYESAIAAGRAAARK